MIKFVREDRKIITIESIRRTHREYKRRLRQLTCVISQNVTEKGLLQKHKSQNQEEGCLKCEIRWLCERVMTPKFIKKGIPHL